MKHTLSVLVLIAGFSGTAHAESYSFACLTNNNAANCASGAAQLRVDVLAYGANQTLFQFYNVGTVSSSITDIYFDDGTLLALAQVFDAPGVSYSVLASPGNLPGGNSIDPAFQTTAGFSADSDAPVSINGVNPGETVGIVFDLQPGKTHGSVIDALSLGGAPGGLRIGLHVQGFSNDGSESFINAPAAVSAVPEASQWLMMMLGLGMIAARTLRRQH